MIPEWVRQGIYNLQERVKKLETGNLVEDVRQQAVRECAETVATIPAARDAILRKFGILEEK